MLDENEAMILILGGIFLSALLFTALLWSLFRIVATQGFLRINALVLSLATVLGMAGLTYQIPFLVMVAAPASLLFGLAQMMTDPGWSKLFPLVQFIFGFTLFNVLLFSGP
jgi:hypothetical protein